MFTIHISVHKLYNNNTQIYLTSAIIQIDVKTPKLIAWERGGAEIHMKVMSNRLKLDGTKNYRKKLY